MNVNKTQAGGFTLVEMVTVIVLLGILSVGVTGFLKFGAQMFAETSERDELISSGRFAVERLNRELRHALPNSAFTSGTLPADQCIEFTPIVASSTYIDIPVLPEPASSFLSLVKFNVDNYTDGLRVIVYPLTPSDVNTGSGKIYPIESLTKSVTQPWRLDLLAMVHFNDDSPTRRIYFVDNQVQYCLTSAGELYRHQNGASVLMAQNLIDEASNVNAGQAPFKVNNATRYRNATVQVRFIFTRNFEQVTFNNDVQVPNVP